MWNYLKRLFKVGHATPDHVPRLFALEFDGEVIAKIAVDDIDFPWTYGHLFESAKFERFRTYFTDVDSWPEDDPELEQVCSEVHAKGHFRLRCLETSAVFTDVVLHHEGNLVWFRYRPEDNT
ncbi:hypothetical protein [Microvirga solisilvae]|uniref:hypothetical protein n=1 Tax=Microvirga solisilvae TaxID=2919498 RepID=UPI001FAFAC80|nr:hypothetical protein [Microvirga solisilvae]